MNLNNNPEFTEPRTKWPVKGNSDFMVTNKFEIYSGDKLVSGHEEDTFKISLFGLPEKEYKKSFLWYLSSTPVFIHPSFPEHVNRLLFVKNLNPLYKEVVVPIFKTPQTMPGNNTLRFVPGNSFLLIGPDGSFYTIDENLELKSKTISLPRNKNVLPTIMFRGNRYLVHRLVAITWCTIKSTDSIGHVSHLDNDKHNFHPSNLSFIGYSSNTQGDNRNRPNINGISKPVKVRDIVTKDVTIFPSITLASYYIGRSRMSFTNIELKPGKIWSGDRGFFEVKYCEDPTDWVYDKLPEDLSRSSTEIENNPLKFGKSVKITVPGKFVRIFKSLEDMFNRLLNLPRTTENYRKYPELVKQKFPNATIEIIESKEYEARNYKTGDVVNKPNLGEIGLAIGIPKSTVTKYCSLGKLYNGWFIRVKNPFVKEPWPNIEEQVPDNACHQVVLVSVTTGEEKEFDSIRKAAVFLNMSSKRGVISQAIKDGSSVNGWYVKLKAKNRVDLSTDNSRSFKTGEYIRDKY